MRIVIYAIIGVVLLAFGVVQAASDALYAGAAAPFSLASRVPTGIGLRVYRFLDRVAPAEYVEASLATYELDRGHLAAAQRYALRLPPRAVRNELLGRIALRSGDPVLAREYFFAAPDFVALQHEAHRIARDDPAQAYAFERRVRDRFVALRTHPDSVAEASWTMSTFAARCALRGGPARRSWLRRSLRDASAAARLAPLSVKYLLAAAAAASHAGELKTARRYYRRVRAVDPSALLP